MQSHLLSPKKTFHILCFFYFHSNRQKAAAGFSRFQVQTIFLRVCAGILHRKVRPFRQNRPVYRDDDRAVCILASTVGITHSVDRKTFFLRGGIHNIATRTHTEGVNTPSICKVCGHFIRCCSSSSAYFSPYWLRLMSLCGCSTRKPIAKAFGSIKSPVL